MKSILTLSVVVVVVVVYCLLLTINYQKLSGKPEEIQKIQQPKHTQKGQRLIKKGLFLEIYISRYLRKSLALHTLHNSSADSVTIPQLLTKTRQHHSTREQQQPSFLTRDFF